MVDHNEIIKSMIPTGSTGEVRLVCPICTPERKPQNQNERDLAVNADEGTWYCHHCQEAGSFNGKAKPKYKKPNYKPSTLPQGVVKFFAGRGISEKTLANYHIGFQPGHNGQHGAVIFPRYKGGEVVALKYRTHDKRLWQSKNPEPCFYNRDQALAAGGDTLVITEGEIDALSFIEAGIYAVASVPDGAPGPNAKNLQNKFKFLDDGLVEKFKSYVLAVDGDEPGKALEGQLADRLGRHNCLRVHYPDGCKDANDVLVKHGKVKLHSVYRNAKPLPIDGLYTADDIREALVDLYDAGLRPGLSTGWGSVDKLYTVRTCEMTVITGIPGAGKSTWLDALTVNMNRYHHWRIAYCSPENWPVQRHMANIVEKIACKPFAASTQTADRLTKDELEKAIKQIDKNFFFTQLQDEDMSIDGVLNVMQAAISMHGVQGIVLDPWNELEYHRPTHMNESEFVSQSLGKIRRFARMNNVHVWIVAHPTKLKRNDDGTYPVPRLYDISGSAHFHNKADNGIAVYRRDPRIPNVEVHVQKIRFREVGQIGSTSLKFVKDCGIYKELGEMDMEEVKRRSKEKDIAPF